MNQSSPSENSITQASEKISSKENGNIPETDEVKIDPITALQDTIDSFFLSLFEALRSTRSAVTPEGLTSGSDNSSYPEYDEFLTQLQNEEEPATSLLSLSSGETLDIPRNRDEYTRLLEQIEKDRDEDLVFRLAQNVLDKSAEVDLRVSTLPGIDRKKDEQMERVRILLQENIAAADELDAVYKEAEDKLYKVRNVLQKETCNVLGIEEEL